MVIVNHKAPIQDAIFGAFKENVNAASITKDSTWITIESVQKRTKTVLSSTHKMESALFVWTVLFHPKDNANHIKTELLEGSHDFLETLIIFTKFVYLSSELFSVPNKLKAFYKLFY